MLTNQGCSERRARLWNSLPEPADALILTDPKSLIYFANFYPSPFVFRSCDASGFLLLTPDKATLIADTMSRPFLDRAHVDEVVLIDWYDGKKTPPQRRLNLLAGFDLPIPGHRIGLEAASTPTLFESGQGTHAFAIEDTIRTLRRKKDADELALIRRSVAAGEAGHARALEKVRPGMTEMEVFRIVQDAATEAAGEPVIVYGDFVSGPRCETERGGMPSSRVIEAGDLLLLDFSVEIFGYRADFTNTFAVGRPPTSQQRELFDACVEAIARAESVLRPGVKGREVDGAVRDYFRGLGLEHAWPSHTGHGLGLSHPEPPFLVRDGEDILVAGDVVAIEPGLFLPGVGGMRFEHNYVITEEGFERLTHHRITLEA